MIPLRAFEYPRAAMANLATSVGERRSVEETHSIATVGAPSNRCEGFLRKGAFTNKDNIEPLMPEYPRIPVAVHDDVEPATI
jgi:hypothetical protein